MMTDWSVGSSRSLRLSKRAAGERPEQQMVIRLSKRQLGQLLQIQRTTSKSDNYKYSKLNTIHIFQTGICASPES